MSLWVKSYSVAIHTKATEQSFPVVWCIMLHKEVLTVESVGEMLKCYYSNESHWTVLPYAAQGGFNFCLHKSYSTINKNQKG